MILVLAFLASPTIDWKFGRLALQLTPFLRRIKTSNMSPKKTGNTLSCSLLINLPQNISADFECAPWATAHTVKVITVHWGSVGCLQPTPSSEWFLKGPHLISPFTQWAACSPHLLLSDSSKPAPYFTVLSVKCNWSRIQSKKSCTHQDSVKKILPAAQFVS